MSETYLVRAKLEFSWEFEEEESQQSIKVPKQLPVNFGPFCLDRSPNAKFYLMNLGLIDEVLMEGLNPDRDYPISLLFIELKIQTERGQQPEYEADDILEQLEAMLRLFQEGDVALRRHYYHTWRIKEGNPKPVIFLSSRPPKPEPATLYPRKPYKLEDEALHGFIEFFNSYWDIINQKHQPIYNALYRFNSSYERRTLSDRLIELMIGMEALFGDKEYQRYKIPLRCACMLYPPGKVRKQAFATIKKFYDERSAIIHGGKLELGPNSKGEVDQFEEYTRRSILKFLEVHKDGCPITSGAQLDDLLFFDGE